MPVLMNAKVPGMDAKTYEETSNLFMEKIKTTKGFIAHCASPIPGGFMITEIWESKEDFDLWLSGTVMPHAMKAGMAPPIIEITPAYRAIGR